MSRVPRAFIHYNCIPHYRRAIFQRLCARNDIELTIVADTKADTPYLKVIRNDPAIRQMVIRTFLIKIPKIPTFYLQPGAVKKVLSHRPDCIIALGNPYSITTWLLLITGKFTGTPILLWTQGLLRPEWGVRWLIRGSFYRFATGYLLYGNHARKLMTKHGIDPEKMYVVYNSLDYQNQAQIDQNLRLESNTRRRHEFGVKAGEGLVVFTGRFQPVKRLDLLVSAISELARRGKRVHLALVGDGSERNKIAIQTAKLGITDLVHFLGENYDEAFLGRVYSAADLCVIPSGAGLTIMHAMTFGCPVLLHDRIEMHFPEWEAVREGETGFFYRYGDQADLTRKIEMAIFPEPKRRLMSDACRRTIRERYNPIAQEETFVRAVFEAIGNRK